MATRQITLLTALLLAPLAALHAADDARLAVQSADDARTLAGLQF